MRKIKILYEEKDVDLDMLDTVLGCFNQDMTVKDVRDLINRGKENENKNLDLL